MRILLPLSLLLCGCAGKETNPFSYWDKVSGTPQVHHVRGKIDSLEKLSNKALSPEQVKAAKLPKGKYYAVSQERSVIPSPTPNPTPKKPDRIAELSDQVAQLKRQVKAMRETHSSPSPTPETETKTGMIGNNEVASDTDQPRISQ
jgi:outer membrane murein-binding lipoprotein Lpp